MKLNLKFMLKGSKTIKIIKSKNRRGLTQVKAIFFAYKQTRNIDILWQQGNPRQKILFLVVLNVLSIILTYWMQNIEWERTITVFITEPFIGKTISSWDSLKKFKKSHQRQARNQKFSRAEVSRNLDEHFVKNLGKKRPRRGKFWRFFS